MSGPDFSYEERYFAEAITEWEDVAERLGGAYLEAREIPRIPQIWVKNGGLNDSISKLNELSTLIEEKLLAVGELQAKLVASRLRRVATNYFEIEDENLDQAMQIHQED